MTSAESGALCDLARDSGLAAGVNYNMRFYPLNWEVRAMVRSGALGRIHSVYGSYVQGLATLPDRLQLARAERGGPASCARSPTSVPTGWTSCSS